MPAERLQKLLARAGHGSRRSAEQLIVAGRVTVDGRVAALGERADPERERVAIDGRPLVLPEANATWMLHKPEGYLVTASDERGRRTIYDLLSITVAPQGLRYVGRLDRDSAGLLLLTTDGDLAFRLAHPRYRVPKRYEAEVEGVPSPQALDQLRHGVELEDGPTAPAKVQPLETVPGGALLLVTIHEGRKRQIRRMLAAVGHPVRRLTRVEFGGLRLGVLRPGEARSLTAAEVDALRRLVRLEAPGEVGTPVDAPAEASL
ncbi:MAG: rRNA pseudouridine synthase [Dehalococcoidia bacterium]|nr:rRNA pseudouridine synthase [Dehalococcoidia bacterium]